jgi:hypothetical protein
VTTLQTEKEKETKRCDEEAWRQKAERVSEINGMKGWTNGAKSMDKMRGV